MILEFIEEKPDRLRYRIKYSQEIDGYMTEDEIVGYKSKNIKEVIEILRVVKQLPLGLREKILQYIIIDEYRHEYIIKEVIDEIHWMTQKEQRIDYENELERIIAESYDSYYSDYYYSD